MDKIIQDSKEAEERLTRSLKSKDAEIEALRSEINRLNDEKITELETLESENVALKAKLRDTSDNFSPSMNMEKEQIKHDLALNVSIVYTFQISLTILCVKHQNPASRTCHAKTWKE